MAKTYPTRPIAQYNEIPNRALIIGLPVLKLILTKFYNAYLDKGYHPPTFKYISTVTLYKPGKGDYSLVGAYRPITLLPIIGKALETIIANRLS